MASDARLAEVRALLQAHGWKLTRVSGSHHVFTKPGELPISIPVHRNRVKAVYVKKIKQILEADGGATRRGDRPPV